MKKLYHSNSNCKIAEVATVISNRFYFFFVFDKIDLKQTKKDVTRDQQDKDKKVNSLGISNNYKHLCISYTSLKIYKAKIDRLDGKKWIIQ